MTILGAVPFAILESDIAPVLIMASMAVVAIVAILVKHQQKMAMILHGRVDPQQVEEENAKALAIKLVGAKAFDSRGVAPEQEDRMRALEAQVQELKQLVYQQTLLLDDVAKSQRSVEQVRQRLDN